MKFKIAVDELQNIFAKLTHVVRPTDEGTVGMVLIEADNSGLRFKVANGNVNLMIEGVKFEVIEKGKSIIRYRDIKSYIFKYFPLVEDYGTESFQFELSGEEGLLKTKTIYKNSNPVYKSLKFPVFNVTFPTVKPFDEAHFIINSDILKKGTNRVFHCINPNEVRRAITGLNVTVMPDKIVFTGTNGIKLTEFSLSINADIEQKSYIFNHDLAGALRSVLDDDAQVFVRLDPKYAYFKSNNLYLSGGLILGEDFPNYKSMFNLQKVITIPRLSFYDSVHTVTDVLDPEDNSRVSIRFEGDTLYLKNDKMESEQRFDAPFEHSLKIDANGMFLDSLLKDFVGDNLEVHFTEGNNYVVFKSVEFPNHTALLTLLKRR